MDRRRWISWLMLLAVVLISYANVYQNEYVYDDEFLVQKNQNIRTWDGVTLSFLMSSTGGAGMVDSFYRPLQGVLYTIVYQVHGLYPDGFHLLNVLLHALNAILIFTLAMRLGFSGPAALIGSLIWAVHPMHTEAVTYVSATADPLYATFMLAGLICAAPEFSWGSVWLSILFFVGGLLSKETAIVFPAVMMVCVFLMNRRRWSIRPYLVTLPLWAVAIGYLVLRKTVLDFNNTFEIYTTANVYTESVLVRLATFFATIPSYVSLIFWPTNLHMDRAFAVFTDWLYAPVLLGIAWLLLGIFMIAWERKSSRPVWSFAFLWFLAAHVPHMGVLLPVNSFFLEHWMYVPSIGFFIVASETLMTWTKSSRRVSVPATALVILLAALLSVLTFRQNQVWSTPISLYTHILKLNPNVARVHNNLAMAYSDLHEDRLAIEHYSKAIELSDVYPQTHHNLGLLYLRNGQAQEAKLQFERALQLDPHFSPSLHQLNR
jgi:hypothetical protein